MKIITKIMTIIVALCLLFSTLTFSVSSASSAIIAFSKSNIGVGDSVTVTVTVNPNVEMYAVGFYLQYNDSVLKYEGGSGVGGAGALQVVESPSGQKSVRYSFKFSALKTGTSNISVTDCVYDILSDGAAKTMNFEGASAKLTVKNPELSSNAKLKSLKISGYSLSPSFSSSKTSYTLKVPYETKKINISATASNKNAKVVSVEGNKDLKVGKNTVTVTVEAEDGSQKKYTIKVTRLEKETSSENTSSNDNEEKEDNEDKEEESEEKSLLTTVAGTEYTIATTIPKSVLFKGFTIEKTKVNGYDIETAVDSDKFFRIFYLKPSDNDELVPYLYDETLDEFEKLKYTVIGDRYYIFTEMPEDFSIPESLYDSKVTIGGVSVKCLSDTNTEMSDFHYVYCYSNGNFNLYRFDSAEQSLQRFPNFVNTYSFTSDTSGESVFERFSSLSTGGKIIIIAFLVIIIGIFTLLIMLITHLIKKNVYNNEGVILSAVYEDFDEVDINTESNILK